MNRKIIPICTAICSLVAVGGASLAISADAHHSFAMFDSTKARDLDGVVQRFDWANPHVTLYMREGSSTGNVWSIELTSPGNLRRLGWTRTTLQPGDEVVVSMNPLRDGRRGGGFRSVTFKDSGETLTASLIEVERQ